MASSTKRLKQNDGRSDSEMYGESTVDDKKRAAMDSHCEIERRRRNKMVSLVNELADIVPECNLHDKRKPDKLTILKLAVDHLRALKNSSEVQDEPSDNKSSFLSDSELKKLVLEATSGFLFIVMCCTGKIIYVSDTISEVLGTPKTDWDDANLYTMVHPEDRPLLKKQLKVEDHELQQQQQQQQQQSCNTSQASAEDYTNAPDDLCRRSFIVKMKTKRNVCLGEEERRRRRREVVVIEGDARFVVVHVTGYIRHWPIAADYSGHQSQLSSQSCLVAIGHCKQRFVCDESEGSSSSSSSSSTVTSFLARHNKSGVFTFVDSRVSKILGHKTVDLLQRSIFDFCHESDHYIVKEALQHVIEKKDQVVNVTLRIINCSGSFSPMKLSCSAFLNPFSEMVEYISATYTAFPQTCNATVFQGPDLEPKHGKRVGGGAPSTAPRDAMLPTDVLRECTGRSTSFSSREAQVSNRVGRFVEGVPGRAELPCSFGVAPTLEDSSSLVYDDRANWFGQQVCHKQLDRNSNVALPDYNQHMNMFSSVQASESYHQVTTGQGIYHWPTGPHFPSSVTSDVAADFQRFFDPGSLGRGSTSSTVTPWNAYDAIGPANFPYPGAYPPWPGDPSSVHDGDRGGGVEDDLNEVMNLLDDAVSSQSAAFGAVEGNVAGRFGS